MNAGHWQYLFRLSITVLCVLWDIFALWEYLHIFRLEVFYNLHHYANISQYFLKWLHFRIFVCSAVSTFHDNATISTIVISISQPCTVTSLKHWFQPFCKDHMARCKLRTLKVYSRGIGCLIDMPVTVFGYHPHSRAAYKWNYDILSQAHFE